ncbi:hypothetical protein Patl1_34434 [Pistacia atlantica]|uniref:Uncharacterized protein n=1 Tax=Pistacia atlantica TaxID=434234 RepID=A0ACC0ZSM7_9ROSI|nr:hypothetical protein Patl1_34434 [Pistacia atlantica]
MKFGAIWNSCVNVLYWCWENNWAVVSGAAAEVVEAAECSAKCRNFWDLAFVSVAVIYCGILLKIVLEENIDEVNAELQQMQVLLFVLFQIGLRRKVRMKRILTDGFGSTIEMTEKDLIWVACWSHTEVDHYPSWADVVEVDVWNYMAGRKGLRCDWLIREFNTSKTLIRATS